MFIFKNIEELPIKYYGNGDLSGGLFVKYVIDNIDAIRDNIDEINKSITSQNELYQYLWARSFKEMTKEIDFYNINDEEKNKIKEIDDRIHISLGPVIKYINDNYELVFSKERNNEIMWYKYFELLFEICYKFCSKSINKNVFKFLEKNYYLDILALFEYCDNYYKKNRKDFESIFKNLQETDLYDDKIYIDFLMKQTENDDFFRKQATFICERVINEFEKNTITDDNSDIIQLLSVFEEYYLLANKYKLICANKYNKMRKELLDVKDSYLLKHGQQIKIGPIDFASWIELLKKDNNILKFLPFTHKLDNDNYLCIFDDIIAEANDKFLFDFAKQPGRASSLKYPYSKQESIDECIEIYKYFINCFVVDEQLCHELGTFILSICKELENKFFDNSINISREIAGEYEMVLNIIALGKQEKTNFPIFKALTNGCVMNMCGTIEKIVRNVVLKEKKDISYFDPCKNTLGKLLENDIKYMSKGLVYCLRYYLCSEHIDNVPSSEWPGRNIRNIQMHNYDYKYDETTESDCFALLFLIVCILNDLTLKNIK